MRKVDYCGGLFGVLFVWLAAGVFISWYYLLKWLL